MNKLENMIIEYVENENAVEDDYRALEDALRHTSIAGMKPTSPNRRLVIAAKLYVEATRKSAIRRHYREMVKEVKLLS